MPRKRTVPHQPSLFDDPNKLRRDKLLHDLREKGKTTDCVQQLELVLDKSTTYSPDFNPRFHEQTIEALGGCIDSGDRFFKAAMNCLELACHENKLPQALAHLPKEESEIDEKVNTMIQLRRLGLPLTGDALSAQSKVLAKWDEGLKCFDPTSRKHQSKARAFYYKLIAYNSAVSVPGNVFGSAEKPYKPITPGAAFLVYRTRLDSFTKLHDRFPARFAPPADTELNDFLIMLPNHTEEYVKGHDFHGHPHMKHEEKLSRWYSRVAAIGNPIKEPKYPGSAEDGRQMMLGLK